MKYVLATLVLFVAISAYAQEQSLTGRDYGASAIGQKEKIIMQLLDELVSAKNDLVKMKEELKKYKENSWLP